MKDVFSDFILLSLLFLEPSKQAKLISVLQLDLVLLLESLSDSIDGNSNSILLMSISSLADIFLLNGNSWLWSTFANLCLNSTKLISRSFSI